jgi:hypothetical protein
MGQILTLVELHNLSFPILKKLFAYFFLIRTLWCLLLKYDSNHNLVFPVTP